MGSDCSQNFTSPTGLIESPGYPDKYPHNLECHFIIIVPPGMDVTLSFLTFDLENDPLPGSEGDCKYDWLEVWDGLPGEIQSFTGVLSLSFHTDMAVAKDGFSARYNMTHKEVSDKSPPASNPFGMESGRNSPNDQIIVVVQFPMTHRWCPARRRLNNEDNGWTPIEDNNKEYIQVDPAGAEGADGHRTQGAISKETQKTYYVTAFKLGSAPTERTGWCTDTARTTRFNMWSDIMRREEQEGEGGGGGGGGRGCREEEEEVGRCRLEVEVEKEDRERRRLRRRQELEGEVEVEVRVSLDQSQQLCVSTFT
ncbi:hypothetical protein CRUP_031506 [Coryphaenoides rupestris]|nr:hypothetical protein CRUP_031506 [Coryphaenoides rupestris]